MSAATVIATIESAKIAQQLIDELIEAGFKDQDVEILAGDEDEIVAEIVERGFGKDDARGYARAVGRGKTVVAARAAPGKAEKAAAIMERYEGDASEPGSELDDEASVAEVEENVAVGKRKVLSGGVRVTTSVNERPVEETVTLREEQVEVERQPADRKLKPAGGRGGVPGEDGRDARHQRGARGQQRGAGGGRSSTRQAGRGARGEGARQGPPHPGRGRGDQAELAQDVTLSVVPTTDAAEPGAPAHRAFPFRRRQ